MAETLTNNEVPKVDHTGIKTLADTLKHMNKAQLIAYAGEHFGLKVAPELTNQKIIDELLRFDAVEKENAKKTNEKSLAMAVSADDPKIKVKFYNQESPGTEIEFSYSGARGMFGPVNKNGFKKCPKYKLFPGQEYDLPYSVFEHLSSLTWVTHTPVFDSETGMQAGSQPVIKPRFILTPVISKEQLIKAQM